MRSSMLFLCAALFQFIATTGCSREMPSPSTLIPIPANSRSFLALGDSYTIGESVSAAQRFPAQAVSLLSAKGISVREPVYVARTGWTTADLKTAIETVNPATSYDIVTLLIGVNDQYQGMDTAGYRVRFTQLLQKAISLAGNQTAHVYVLSIPDYGVTPFGGGSARISKEIDDFNRINKEVTIAYNISYVDITPISKLAAVDQTYTAGDGLHPSGKQYIEWAKKLVEIIRY